MAEIDWSGIRAAAAGLQNIDRAALIAGKDLPDHERNRFLERVRKRSQRENWRADWNVQIAVANEKPLSRYVQNGAETLAAAISDSSTRARVSLAKAAEKGAKAFETMPGERLTERDTSGAFRNVTAAASQIGGWDQKQDGGTNVTVNVGIVS
jgi:hypothetical protein